MQPRDEHPARTVFLGCGEQGDWDPRGITLMEFLPQLQRAIKGMPTPVRRINQNFTEPSSAALGVFSSDKVELSTRTDDLSCQELEALI